VDAWDLGSKGDLREGWSFDFARKFAYRAGEDKSWRRKLKEDLAEARKRHTHCGTIEMGNVVESYSLSQYPQRTAVRGRGGGGRGAQASELKKRSVVSQTDPQGGGKGTIASIG